MSRLCTCQRLDLLLTTGSIWNQTPMIQTVAHRGTVQPLKLTLSKSQLVYPLRAFLSTRPLPSCRILEHNMKQRLSTKKGTWCVSRHTSVSLSLSLENRKCVATRLRGWNGHSKLHCCKVIGDKRCEKNLITQYR